MTEGYLQAFVAVMESGRVYRVAVTAEGEAAGLMAAGNALREAAPGDAVWSDLAAYPVGAEMQARGPHVALLVAPAPDRAREAPDLLNGFPVLRSEKTPARGALRAGRVVMVDRGRETTPGRYVIAWAYMDADSWIAGEYVDSEMDAHAAFARRLERETQAAERRLSLREMLS